MACVSKEILIDADPETVWSAVRDVGAVHRRLATGFVADTRLDGNARIVTFANGAVVRELIVSIDDRARRLSYAAVGGRSAHHNASMQVFVEGENRTRLVWITDVLPDEVAGFIGAMVDQGAAAIKKTLERRGAP
jgi:carbon monoxide dehydrogenase subunit G